MYKNSLWPNRNKSREESGYRFKTMQQSPEQSNYICDLSEERRVIAEKAKEAAKEILQDALEKGFYGYPVKFHFTCSKYVDPLSPFCCIPTKNLLQDLLTKMGEISFKEVTDPDFGGCFAYVYANDESNIVYLCEMFWDAPDNLCEDSKPGTLIHEVSHLLGTEDITYEHLVVELYEDHGTLLGKPQRFQSEEENDLYCEEVAQVNANSLEYEFETIINHEGNYENGQYLCCGETKRYSVCKERPTAHYHLHERFSWNKEEMERRLGELRGSLQAGGSAQRGKLRYVKRKNQACWKTLLS